MEIVMSRELHPSFSPARKWSLVFDLTLSLAAVLALVIMVNYLAARHFQRWSLSSLNASEMSPLTQRIVAGITNDVRITVYFSRREPLYEMTRDLLKSYQLANNHLVVDLVDYERDPGAAQAIKATYKLSDKTDRDMVIFDCQGRGLKFVYQSDLSELDIQPLVSGQSREVRRTAFKGELLFTSALRSVVNSRQLKAYFLQGHEEHDPDSTDNVNGYAEFARVLDENNVKHEKLTLEGSAEIPADCSLLIIAGPVGPLMPEVLEKIDRYLKQGQGGRLLMLFRFESLLLKPTGLEALMGKWGVAVGRNVVRDEKMTQTGNDVVLANFSGHPLIKAFINKQIQLFLPRSIGRESSSSTGADAPQVDVLAETTAAGRIVRDIRDRSVRPTPSDPIGQVPVMVAVEKGGIRNVSADRGTTRIVVIGDSYLFGNETIERGANHQFASQTINWLLAQNELLADLPPRPIKEFKVTMTTSEMKAAQWLLLAAFPGSVLALGGLVWIKRRR
jgi:hypothetical protein